MKTPFLHTIFAIIHKDLRAEWHSRQQISLMIMFALLSVLIFSFALELNRVVRQEAVSGVLWVTLVFASILGLNRNLAIEREHGSLDAMRLAPIDRSALFIGKVVGNYLFTLIVGMILLPVMSLIYNLTLLDGWVILTLLLGTLGFATVGTLLATLAVQTRAREALLPIAMLPVALPLLIVAVRATTGIINETPFSDWIVWIQIVAVVDVIYLVLCTLFYRFILEE